MGIDCYAILVLHRMLNTDGFSVRENQLGLRYAERFDQVLKMGDPE